LDTCDFVEDTDNCFNKVFATLEPIDVSIPDIPDEDFTIDYSEFYAE
jgi:hypothetical protein